MRPKNQNPPDELQVSIPLDDNILHGFGTTLNSLGTVSYERHIYISNEGTKQTTITWDKVNGIKNVQTRDLTVKKTIKKRRKILNTMKEVVKSVAEVTGTYHGAYDKAKGS